VSSAPVLFDVPEEVDGGVKRRFNLPNTIRDNGVDVCQCL
jgi:hypothetical protein